MTENASADAPRPSDPTEGEGFEPALAAYVASLDAGALAPSATRAARQMILDAIGVTLAGATEPAAVLVRDHVRRDGCHGRAAVWGSSLRTSVSNAALANGVAAHVLDFDDGHVPSSTHASAVLVPALLAAGEDRRATGSCLLTSYIAGIEAMTALGRATVPQIYQRGWHTTSAIGTLGAAAGVARLLGLDATAVGHALRIAASSSHGLRSNFGSPTKPFHAGTAARDGVVAALLAADGFAASSGALVGSHGFVSVFTNGQAPEGDPMEDLDGTGSTIQPFVIKRFPSCAATHTAIEAAIELRQVHGLRADEVGSVRCYVDPNVPEILLSHLPSSGLEAKFSLEHCFAVGLARGEVTLGDFTDEAVRDPEVRSLAQKVRVLRGPEQPWSTWGTTVEAERSDGRAVSVHRPVARGHSGFEALSWGEVVEKFLMCSKVGGLDEEQARRVVEMVRDLEAVPDVSEVVRHLEPSADRERTMTTGLLT